MIALNTETPRRSFIQNRVFRHALAPMAAMLLFAAALFVLQRILKPYKLHDIQQAFHAMPLSRIGLCLLFTSLSYGVLSGYDTLACRYVGKPLAYRKIALTSFLSYAFANNTGSLSIISSGSTRYRLYGGWGFSGLEVARIIGFCMLTFWLGCLTLAGITLLSLPLALPPPLQAISPFVERLIGALCLVPVVGYLLLCSFWKKTLRIKQIGIPAPPARLALGQLLVSTADLICFSAALFVLMPFSTSFSFFAFVGICILAFVIGLVSNVPGGLGIFEGALLLLLGPVAVGPQFVGALLTFRVIYFLLPLAVSVAIFGAMEFARRRAGITRLTMGIHSVVSTLLPHVFAFATFAAGAILLFSGTLPAIDSRLNWLDRFVPLPVLELSHFLNSMVGSLLLILAIGLRRRLDMAYLASCAMLFAGIVFALFKGLDFEVATMLTVLLVALYSSREQFYRKASLLAEPLSAGWFAAIFLVLAGSLWLGFFAYRHQDYSSELWWNFTLHGNASRFLRATIGISTTLLLFALIHLFRPSQPRLMPPTKAKLLQTEQITHQSGDIRGYLALLGDKSLLFSETGDAFLMYGVKGRSWIAMGEPIGNPAAKEELLWKFRNLSEFYGGWPVFYEIGRENLAQFVDLGLNIIKIGEEGRVSLPGFSLEGSARKNIRYIYNRVSKEGFSFAIIPPAEIMPLLPVLEEISSSWLADKKTAEKGFSLGFFNKDYLLRFPIAVVKKKGKILAFTNLWLGDNRQELSIDLMRYIAEAPRGIMDYLFISVMLWGKEHGYQWFSFGMAPLAGLESQKEASLWGNIGSFVYRHGEHFYNFQGLREYKDKFDPLWEARYLAYPHTFSLPAIFINLTSLISGGLRGAIQK